MNVRNISLFLSSAVVLFNDALLGTDAFQPPHPSFSSKTRIQYADTMDPPPLKKETIEKIGIIPKTSSQPVKERIPNKINSDPRARHVFEVTNLPDYKEVVADEREKLTIVRFYATWCRACKQVEHKYYRLGTEFPNTKSVEVPYTQDNAYLHQCLDVPAIPYGFIYHPTAGLVEQMRINKKNFADFKKIIASYEDQECVLPDLDPETNMYEAPYKRA